MLDETEIWKYAVNKKAKKYIGKAERLKLLMNLDPKMIEHWHILCGSQVLFKTCPFRLEKGYRSLCLAPKVRGVRGCYLYELGRRALEIVPRIRAWVRRAKV